MTSTIDTDIKTKNNTSNSIKVNNSTNHKSVPVSYSTSIGTMDDTSKSRKAADQNRRSASVDEIQNSGTIINEKTTGVRQNESSETNTSPVASGVLQSTVPVWANLLVVGGLIFGGCCSNVFALEAIVKEEPESGHLVTFAQFLLVATEGFIHFFDRSSPTLLAPTQIPLSRWWGVIILFFSISVLNNLAFQYHISVPVHIILRSGGSVTTMLLGIFVGKRYSQVQMLSVAVLTIGVVLAAMSNAKSIGESEHSLPRFLTGLTILFLTQIMAAVMGMFIENTYEKYGSNWREGLFYTHALSLPLFLPFSSTIYVQFLRLYHSKPLPLPQLLPYLPDSLTSIKIPYQLFYLFINAVTQYICVRGVNYLSGMSSALTVTIVLNIRKLISLVISIWLFGNSLSPGVVLGAVIVFAGAFVYGVESQRQSKLRREAATKSQRLVANVHVKD